MKRLKMTIISFCTIILNFVHILKIGIFALGLENSLLPSILVPSLFLSLLYKNSSFYGDSNRGLSRSRWQTIDNRALSQQQLISGRDCTFALQCQTTGVFRKYAPPLIDAHGGVNQVFFPSIRPWASIRSEKFFFFKEAFSELTPMGDIKLLFFQFIY